MVEMWDYIIEIRVENKQIMDNYETVIHNILKIKELDIKNKNGGGKKIFKIKPKEINQIVSLVIKIIFENKYENDLYIH